MSVAGIGSGITKSNSTREEPASTGLFIGRCRHRDLEGKARPCVVALTSYER